MHLLQSCIVRDVTSDGCLTFSSSISVCVSEFPYYTYKRNFYDINIACIAGTRSKRTWLACIWINQVKIVPSALSTIREGCYDDYSMMKRLHASFVTCSNAWKTYMCYVQKFHGIFRQSTETYSCGFCDEVILWSPCQLSIRMRIPCQLLDIWFLYHEAVGILDFSDSDWIQSISFQHLGWVCLDWLGEGGG